MGPICQRRRTAIPLWPQEGDELGESVEILHEIEVSFFYFFVLFELGISLIWLQSNARASNHSRATLLSRFGERKYGATADFWIDMLKFLV